jgi:NhaA family Na+:H+ antiporter
MRQIIKNFVTHQAFGGVALMAAAGVALGVANSPLSDAYDTLLNRTVGLSVVVDGVSIGLNKPLVLWVNDALMALFFLLVGLEIKREWVTGALSTRAKVLQPLFAAVGGMVVPALLFMLVNFHHPINWNGWAIPTATDIAFALGVLMLAGRHVPATIKILLTAIAILDDLGAILIIAFFYSGDMAWGYMALGAVGVAGLALLNRARVNRIAPYILCGLVVWVGLLKSGVHPTLAGVITAFFIPLRMKHKTGIKAPLIRLEHGLHPWVVFGVLPLFALANAGLSFDGLSWADMAAPLPVGIMLGLLVGKPVGIMAGLWLGHVTGAAPRPAHTGWGAYAGMAFLCGIGFTMALFIGELAFADLAFRDHVKLGVLSASLLSAGMGWGLCRFGISHKN